jgi:hypothetical protein
MKLRSLLATQVSARLIADALKAARLQDGLGFSVKLWGEWLTLEFKLVLQRWLVCGGVKVLWQGFRRGLVNGASVPVCPA